ncbi:unnamed protein product [Dovyalis caffra]|uniref:Uncharacterized protein n=1 Tax=Dovyalis caffra TaxID=77055 RepID=A0AAV1R1N9_9ROSI|nr:unnamed protein product [Dovyalis caffra]
MNPYERPLTSYEQTLRDEVIYLHSLWHQGPPTPNPNPNPNLYLPSYGNYSSRNLHVSNPTPFKKTNRHKPKYQKANNVALSGLVSDPGLEWPVSSPQPSPPQSGSGWPGFKSNPSPLTRPVSEVDQGPVAAMRMQQKVVKCCNQFFVKRVDLDENGDKELEQVDGDEGCPGNDNVVEESEEFKFFLSLFVENKEMRDFYEKNTESGDFYCLVCGGIGEKVGKVYRGCTGLVQHARAISKTKRKRAHRAFGHLICKVLGWDISRLPMIVLTGEPLSRSLVNSGLTENFSDEGNCKKVRADLSNDEPNMEAYKEGATECPGSEPPLVSDAPWTSQMLVDESPSTTVGWPILKPHHSSETSAEELERFAMVRLQQKVLNDCRNFLANPSGSISDEGEEDGDQDDWMDEDGSDECEEFKFFLRLFTDSNELRNYYENHYEGGEFCCLVCCALKKKGWRKFKGCLGLLQHATAISRTKKKAHRAYGQVICKVLGWDVDQLPTIVLKGEPLRQSMEKSGILLGEPEINADCGHEDSSFPQTETFHGNVSASASREDSDIHQKNCVLVSCKNTLNGGFVNEHVNDLEKECVKANKLSLVDFRVR